MPPPQIAHRSASRVFPASRGRTKGLGFAAPNDFVGRVRFDHLYNFIDLYSKYNNISCTHILDCFFLERFKFVYTSLCFFLGVCFPTGFLTPHLVRGRWSHALHTPAPLWRPAATPPAVARSRWCLRPWDKPDSRQGTRWISWQVPPFQVVSSKRFQLFPPTPTFAQKQKVLLTCYLD